MQIELFNNEDLLDGEDLAIYKAKLYTAKSIMEYSGMGSIIKEYLAKGDTNKAFNLFDETFKTYGFGIPNGYSFIGVIGRIGYYFNNRKKNANTTSKELFEYVLKKEI